jgi:hypothetical protein
MKYIILIAILWSGTMAAQLMDASPIPLENIGQGTAIRHKLKADSLNIDWMSVNKINGWGNNNIIAIIKNVAQGTPLNFDNFSVSLISGSCNIKTISGTASGAILSEHEYNGGSFAIGNGSLGTPITITTTNQTYGDLGFVPSERSIASFIDFSSGNIYTITIWMHGTSNWSGWVEKTGMTGTAPITASNGIKIVSNDIQLSRQERVGRVQGGDVGSGSTATVTGDFSSVTKSSALFNPRSTFTVTFTNPMPTAFYNVFITPISLGTVQDDNNIRPIVVRGANSTVNSFEFVVEENSGVVQNLEYHIFIKSVTP